MTPSPNVAQPYHNNQDLNETESFLSELGCFHTSYTFTGLLVFEKIFLSTFLCKSLTPNCGQPHHHPKQSYFEQTYIYPTLALPSVQSFPNWDFLISADYILDEIKYILLYTFSIQCNVFSDVRANCPCPF